MKLDEIEALLLFAENELNESYDEDTVRSVYMIRPGARTKRPELVQVSIDDRPYIRLLRATGPVDRPVAFVTNTRIVEGAPSIQELYFVYEPDEAAWKQQRLVRRTEDIQPSP